MIYILLTYPLRLPRADLETIELHYVPELDQPNQPLLDFVLRRLACDAEDATLCFSTSKTPFYLGADILSSRVYNLILHHTAFGSRNIRKLCSCSCAYANGQRLTHNFAIVYGDLRVLIPLVYEVHIFSSATVVLAISVICMACKRCSSVFKCPRTHYLSRKMPQYSEDIIRHCTDLLFPLSSRVVDDPLWPAGGSIYTEYITATQPVLLAPHLVTIDSTSRFVDEACAPVFIHNENRPDVIAIQSPCGSGKSQFAVHAICHLYDQDLLPNGVFLPVATKAQASAHSAAFAKAYAGYRFGDGSHPSTLGIKHYMKDEETVGACFSRGQVDFSSLSCICTINSMAKQFEYFDPLTSTHRLHVPSLLWLDEVVSLLDSLALSENMKNTRGGRNRAIKILEHMIANCTYIIATDAYLTTQCVEYITSLRQAAGSPNTCQVVRLKSRYTQDRLFLHSNNFQEFLFHVNSALSYGLKAIVLSDSKKALTEVFDGVVSTRNNADRLRMYSSDTPDQVKEHDFENCQDVWREIDAVFATPTLTTGVNFTASHFNICFFYATGLSVNARTTMQMINRVRYYTDHEIYIYVPTRYTADSLPSAKREEDHINIDILQNPEYERTLTPLVNANIHYNANNEIVKAPIASLAIGFAREYATSKRNYANEILRFASFSGYSVYLCVPQLNPIHRPPQDAPDPGQPEQPPQEQAPDDDPHEQDCPIKAVADPMQLAHQTAKLQNLQYLVDFDLTPYAGMNFSSYLTAEQATAKRLIEFKTLLGVSLDHPLPLDLLAALFDDTFLASRINMLDYLCRYQPERPRIDEEVDEATFYKRLRPCKLYFVWSYISIIKLLQACDHLPASFANAKHPDLWPAPDHFPSTSIRNLDLLPEHPQVSDIHQPVFTLFPMHIAHDTVNTRLHNKLKVILMKNYHALCKQCNKSVSHGELTKDHTTKNLLSVFKCALKTIGMQCRRTKRGRTTTMFDILPTDSVELFIVRMLREGIFHEPYIEADHTYSLQTFKQLCRFFVYTTDRMRWEDFHGISLETVVEYIKDK